MGVTAAGVIISEQTYGEKIDAGQVAYLKSDGKWYLARANSIATSAGDLAIALDSGVAGGKGRLVKLGYVNNTAWSWTPGAPLYLSAATAGGLTQTRPTGAGNVVREVATVASDPSTIYFDPSPSSGPIATVEGLAADAGDIIVGDDGAWTKIAAGDAGEILASNGAGSLPTWDRVARTATYVVAASDAPDHVKRQADYVCDGTDDHEEIQAAIDALPNYGGSVYVTGGTYICTGTIVLPSNTHLKFENGAKMIIPEAHNLSGYLSGELAGVPALFAAITVEHHGEGDWNENIHIEGAHIDFLGWTDLDGDYAGILINRGYNCLIERCVVENVNPEAGHYNVGIYVVNSKNTNTVRCEGNNCGYEGLDPASRASENCYAIECGGFRNGTHSMQISSLGTKGLQPRSCGFIRCYGDGTIILHGAGGPATPPRDILFLECVTAGRLDLIGSARNTVFRGCHQYMTSSESAGITIRTQDTGDVIDGVVIDHCSFCAADDDMVTTPIAILADHNDRTGVAIRNVRIVNCSFETGRILSIGDRGNQAEFTNISLRESRWAVPAGYPYDSYGIRFECRNPSTVVDGIYLERNTPVGATFLLGSMNINVVDITNISLIQNDLRGVGQVLRKLGPGSLIVRKRADNIGYVTENQGAAASITDGGTIAHGCAATPTTVTVSGSVAGEIVTVTSIDATNITVAIKKPDGSAGTAQTVYWRAEV